MDGDFRLGPWLVEPSLNAVSGNGTTTQLEPKVMAVLVCLAERPGEPVLKEKLLQTVWPDTFVSESVLVRSGSELRRVLEDEAREPRFIQTIAKRGYRLVAPVVSLNGASPQIPASRVPQAALSSGTDIRRRRTWLRAPALFSGAILVLGVLLAFGMDDLRARLTGRSTAPRIGSLAVLPLRSLSGDPAQEYFADAMTEELITELSRISALKVTSRTSVMRYKKTDKPLPEIARELGVDGIVAGSVVRAGDRVRITAQLIYAPEDTNVWAQTYDRDLQDVLSLQSAVAGTIADEIQVKMTPQERSHLKSRRPVNLKAVDAYVDGRYHLDKASGLWLHNGLESQYEGELTKAMAAFDRAVQEDSGYVPAYLGIVDVATNPRHPELIPKARAAIARALQLDDSLAQVHLELADLLLGQDLDWAGAAKELRRAIELNPNSADAHAAYADYLDELTGANAGTKEREIAQQLDPEHNRFANMIFPLGWSPDQNRAYLEERGSNDPVLYAELGKEYQIHGRYKEAIEQYIKGLRILGYHDQVKILQRGYNRGDYKGAILEWMKAWEALSHRKYMPVFWPAFMYANLRDTDHAFIWLEKCYKEDPATLIHLRDDPIWDPIRSDRRFKDLLRRVGLPQDKEEDGKQ